MHDVKYDLIEVLNQMIKDNTRTSINNSFSSDNNNIGHLFITIKFFKFTDNNLGDDNNDELRVLIKYLN